MSSPPPSEDRSQVENRDPANLKKHEMQMRYNSESYTKIYDGRYRQLQVDKWRVLQPYFPNLRGYWLDFGCGTGLTWEATTSYASPTPSTHSLSSSQLPSSPTTSLSSSPTPYRYIGCDLARGMLHQFLPKLSSLYEQLGDNAKPTPVNLICCDGEYLPLRNTLFDAVISFTTLQNLPHPSQGIAEMMRVATSAAPLGISVLQKSLRRYRWEELLDGRASLTNRKVRTLNENERVYQEDWVFLITPIAEI
ncbi:MAG: class I SAM-dependent methyltransferase [Promethearchaeota archaeon]|nr:MAG: class I SAM-dependent methyltransferase [Candidatus Lokiarchaeota archaeon]